MAHRTAHDVAGIHGTRGELKHSGIHSSSGRLMPVRHLCSAKVTSCQVPVLFPPPLSPGHRATAAVCAAYPFMISCHGADRGAAGDAATVCAALQVGRGAATEEAYRAGAEFLRTIGIESQGEIMRVLDVAMNKNSLFGRHRDKKRAINVNVRLSKRLQCTTQWSI